MALAARPVLLGDPAATSVSPQTAAIAVGATVALGTLLFKKPLWAAILLGSAGAVVANRAIQGA